MWLIILITFLIVVFGKFDLLHFLLNIKGSLFPEVVQQVLPDHNVILFECFSICTF